MATGKHRCLTSAQASFHHVRWAAASHIECATRAGIHLLPPTSHVSPVHAPASVRRYVGRLGKAYIDPPMSSLRHRMWAALRGHPNVTFLATDYDEAVTPYLRDPSRPCHRCSYECKRCLDPEVARSPTLGVLPRVSDAAKHEYRSWLTNSTFCLVLRGDNENTRAPPLRRPPTAPPHRAATAPPYRRTTAPSPSTCRKRSFGAPSARAWPRDSSHSFAYARGGMLIRLPDTLPTTLSRRQVY